MPGRKVQSLVSLDPDPPCFLVNILTRSATRRNPNRTGRIDVVVAPADAHVVVDLTLAVSPPPGGRLGLSYFISYNFS